MIGPDDIENHARLAESTSVQVATGEIEAGRWRFLALLQKGATTILQTDAAVCGGITAFRRIAQTAASFGVDLCPHWSHDLHAPLVAAVPTRRSSTFAACSTARWTSRTARPSCTDGPGLGFGFDAQAVEWFAMLGWS